MVLQAGAIDPMAWDLSLIPLAPRGRAISRYPPSDVAGPGEGRNLLRLLAFPSYRLGAGGGGRGGHMDRHPHPWGGLVWGPPEDRS